MNISYLSLIAQENLTNNRNNLSNSLSKLSSGLKINKASDDASGLAISDKLRTQASGIKQAISNSNSAIAFAQIGDKAMSEQSNILDFTKQKLIQAATMTTSDEGRQMILNDIQKSLSQYDNIASSTNYNGTTILQKSSDDQDISSEHTFQVGDNPEDTVTIEVVQANTSYGGGNQVDTLTISGEVKEKDIFTVVINNIPISYVASSSDVGTTEDKHNQVALELKSEIESNSELSKLVTVENTSNGIIKFTSKVEGEAFNINPGTITLGTNISLGTSSSLPAVAQEMTYEFSGTIESGDTYTVGGVAYTVQDSDTSMSDVIDKIIQGLNGTDGGSIVGLNVTSTLSDARASKNSSENLVLTANTAGTAFTPPSYSATNLPSNDDQVISSSTVQNNVVEVAGSAEVLEENFFSLDGNQAVEGGDIYNLRVDGISISYTVEQTDSTKDDIIDGIFNLLSSNTSLSDITFRKESGGITMTAQKSFNVDNLYSTEVSSVDLPTTVSKTKQQDNEEGQTAHFASSNLKLTYDTRPSYDSSDSFEVNDVITYNFGNGESISYTVLNEDYSTNHEGFDTAINVFNKLATLINSDNRFNTKITASVDSTDFMGVDKEAILKIKALDVSLYNPTAGNDSNRFTSNDILLNQDDSTTGVTISGTYSTPDVLAVQSLQEITLFELSGDVTPGSEIYIIFDNNIDNPLGGNDSISYTIQTGDTLIDIKNGLINEFNNSNLSSQTVFISDGSSESLNEVNKYEITLDSNNDIIVKSYIHSANYGISNYQNGGYTSYVYDSSGTNDLDNKLGVWKQGTTNFTPSISQINDYQSEIISISAEQQQEKYTLSGTVEKGDKYTIAGITYEVQASDTTIEDVVDKIIIGLNGRTTTGISGTSSLSAVTASKDSTTSLILSADVAGTPFTLPTYEALNVGTNDQSISLINTVNNVPAGAESFYSISGFINEGNVYDIGGAIYTAQSGDSKEDIIDGLVKSINGDSAPGVSGTALSGVVAAKTPPPIQIIIKPAITYVIDASVNLSNITSNEIKNDLSISSTNVVTLESSTGKYKTYSEDSTINFSHETQDINTENLERVRSLAGLKNLDYLTIDIAKEYMSIVDENLTAINEFRGNFGSAQNQLESVTRNLMTSYVNIKNAESIIRDVDYAIESSSFNKLNILVQAGSFALSQATEQNENILNLLKD